MGLSLFICLSLLFLIVSGENTAFFAQVSIAAIIIFSLYSDIKYRKITNERFRELFLFSFFLNSVEFYYSQDVVILITLKIFFFFLIFIISLTLFSFRIIGGSDGKLFILIFLIHPGNFLSFSFIMMFFLLFSLFFILLFALNYINNAIGVNRYSFEILFVYYLNTTVFKEVFFKTFFIFLNFKEVKEKKENRYQIISYYLIYNNNNNIFQILAHYRPPLVVACLFSYYFAYYLIIGI
jgi:Flp pilus assembly protein protease CpaA